MSASGYKFIWPAAYEGPDRCEFFSQGGKGDAFTTFLKGFYAARGLWSDLAWRAEELMQGLREMHVGKKISQVAQEKILDETIWGGTTDV